MRQKAVTLSSNNSATTKWVSIQTLDIDPFFHLGEID